ncbi:NAD(P)-binding domain-containing protein [Deinococcus malanensis]|uniref:NAD(P)-binding domain-containing protein n=1 Tax=Deinococcus malanensis TaxID=1706855 RepID=UPI003639F5BB
MALKTDIVVIGGGQAGLSAAYHLKQAGLEPRKEFVILDAASAPGGAWQFRWPSLTLSTVNRIHDLPGQPFSDMASGETHVQARVAVPRYFAAYEHTFDLRVLRPVRVTLVSRRGDRFRVEIDRGDFFARGLINATGTWDARTSRCTPVRSASRASTCTPGTTGPLRRSPVNTS